MVGQLFADNIVKLLPWLCGQTNQELVQRAGGVHQLGVEEGGGQRNTGAGLSLQHILLNQTKKWCLNSRKLYKFNGLVVKIFLLEKTLNKSVTKSESCSSKTVDNSRVDIGVISSKL